MSQNNQIIKKLTQRNQYLEARNLILEQHNQMLKNLNEICLDFIVSNNSDLFVKDEAINNSIYASQKEDSVEIRVELEVESSTREQSPLGSPAKTKHEDFEQARHV